MAVPSGDPQFPVPGEPTSVLTFGDLLLHVARELGIAYYGENQDGIAEIPVNEHDLDEVKRHVNNGIRRFLADAPQTGWRWARPVAATIIWPAVAVVTANTCTAVQDSGKTIVTLSNGDFQPTMELKPLVVTDVGTVMITRVLSATQAEVDLNSNAVWSAKTYSIASTGDYTLPQIFAGTVTGAIAYIVDTNQGVPISWHSEAGIRHHRENITDETGDPYWAAIRIMDADGLGRSIRRRWEMIVYPKPQDILTVEFPFELHFDEMTEAEESLPIPFIHDETVRAACMAAAEMDTYDAPGKYTAYYEGKRLPKSYIADGRSAPRKIGYFGNRGFGDARSIQGFRQWYYDRPTVTFS